MKPFKAIAAMSINRVIGKNNTIPWHIPADLAFFKQTTMGHIVIMGSRTYESIGRPLPGRDIIVLTRQPHLLKAESRLTAITHLAELPSLALDPAKDIFIAGGGMLYATTLHLCSDLYLTHINKNITEGEIFFPSFEDLFYKQAILHENRDFTIIHYRNNKLKTDDSITL